MGARGVKPTLWKEVQLRGHHPLTRERHCTVGCPLGKRTKAGSIPDSEKQGCLSHLEPEQYYIAGCPAMPSWSPGPKTHEGHPPVSSPPSPRLLLLYGAAVGKALSENRCLLENLKLQVGGQILAVLWNMSTSIIMQSFTYILDINVVLKYSQVLDAIYMLWSFPLLLLWQYSLASQSHWMPTHHFNKYFYQGEVWYFILNGFSLNWTETNIPEKSTNLL